MLDTLITSKTRKKLLLKFFLNSSAKAYLRHLEQELEESPNALRLELNKFEKANMLQSHMEGNKKVYQANNKHPLFGDIQSIMLKTVGFDQIIENVIKRMGDVDKVYVTGDFAKGVNSNIIDLVFVGKKINTEYLVKLIEKVEKMIDKRVRHLCIKPKELESYIDINNGSLLLWDMRT